VTPLGGGCEVGRSCILLEVGNKKILLDCGIHPSETSLASLPFFDKLDPS
jgi:cleavage and polyadenylation specificity factor subunit 3